MICHFQGFTHYDNIWYMWTQMGANDLGQALIILQCEIAQRLCAPLLVLF